MRALPRYAPWRAYRAARRSPVLRCACVRIEAHTVNWRRGPSSAPAWETQRYQAGPPTLGRPRNFKGHQFPETASGAARPAVIRACGQSRPGPLAEMGPLLPRVLPNISQDVRELRGNTQVHSPRQRRDWGTSQHRRRRRAHRAGHAVAVAPEFTPRSRIALAAGHCRDPINKTSGQAVRECRRFGA